MTSTNPNPVSDADLVRRYASGGSPDAFAAIVDRYLPLIYSAAMRQTRDRHLAEDVSQAALIIFSQKASGIDPSILPGWLMKTTHYAARNAIRQRARRVAHEQRAAAMKSESHIPADPDAVARVIDSALARLRDADRTAVVLRYFQNKSFAEIAAHLQTTEAAAQRRIARAVEKLRGILSRQGVQIAPAAFPAALAAQALHPVPRELSIHATSQVVSNSVSTHLIAQGALHAMAAAKMKAAVGIAAAVLLVGAAVPTAYHYATARPEPEPAAVTVAAAPPLPVGTDMTRPASGSLPPGMTAEPLAIMNVADKRWVGPTGEEFTDMPATVKAQLLRSRMNVQGATHVLLFRVHSPDDATSWTYSVQQVGAMGSTGMYDPATRSNYQLIYFSPPPAAPSVSLTIDAATGPWVSRAVIPATAAAPVTGDIDGVSFTFDPPAEEGNVVRLKRTIPRNAPWGRGLSQSFYALDSAGKKVYFRGSSSDGRTDRYDFPGPLSSYKEFRLDTRSYNYHATYAAVPLPGAKQ